MSFQIWWEHRTLWRMGYQEKPTVQLRQLMNIQNDKWIFKFQNGICTADENPFLLLLSSICRIYKGCMTDLTALSICHFVMKYSRIPMNPHELSQSNTGPSQQTTKKNILWLCQEPISNVSYLMKMIRLLSLTCWQVFVFLKLQILLAWSRSI